MPLLPRACWVLQPQQLDGVPLNETEASAPHAFGWRADIASDKHLLIAAPWRANTRSSRRDTAFGGFTTQDRTRNHHRSRSNGAERIWDRSTLALPSGTTSSPASRMRPTPRIDRSEHSQAFSISANYGEGIAQPTFFDLYGFFPGSLSAIPV